MARSLDTVPRTPQGAGGGPPESAPAPDDPGRRETEAQPADRNVAELVQELRVAALGVQVLFGFLLAVPFDSRLVLTPGQRHLYVATVVLAALATACFTAPVAYHRLQFHRHRKTQLVVVANVLAIVGLVLVGSAMVCALWLVLGVVLRGAGVPVVVVGSAAVFASLWFVLPLAGRRPRTRGRRPTSSP